MLQALALRHVGPNFGKLFIVVPSTDANYDRYTQIFKPDGDGTVRMFSSVESAYAATTSNRNDVIFLAPSNVSHTLAAGMAISNSRTHFIGLGSGRLVDQEAKISLPDPVATAYAIKVTGTRNSFSNIKFSNDSTAGTALTVAQFGGEGTLCDHCSFIFGVNTNLGSTSASEVVFGEDSGTFLDCQFGADTLLTTVARSVMLVKAVTVGQPAKSNRLRGCTWMISSSSASASLFKVNSTSDLLFTNYIEEASFMASVDTAGGIAITNAATSAAGLVAGTVNFHLRGVFNCTNFSASVSDGFKVSAPVASNNAFEAVTPA